MKPNNEFTSPESRFFYPVNHPVEHHESLDTTSLPEAANIPGTAHYVVIQDDAGKVYAAELYWEAFNIPANAKVLGVKGYSNDINTERYTPPFVEDSEFERFDENCSVIPEDPESTSMIVQVDTTHFWGGIPDPRFDGSGVAILPYDQQLPSFAKNGISDKKISYRLLGFIDPRDKLVTWHGDTSHTALLIDWCVANQLKQNRLEEALLHDALPLGADLVGLLSTREAAHTYLRYFDEKYGTSYTPEKDPRRLYSESKFGQLSEADYQTYRRLAELAHSFMTSPR